MKENNEHNSVKMACLWRCNLLDKNGGIITGYEQEMEGSEEEVLEDYLYWLFLEGYEVDRDRVDLELINK